MTTVIPIPPEPAVLQEVSGDPDAVTAYGSSLLTVSSTFDDVGAWVRDSSSPEGWEGAAASAYRNSTRQPADDADAASLALRRVWRATEEYATSLRTLKQQWLSLAEQRRILGSRRTDLIGDVNSAGQSTPAEITELEDRARVLGNEMTGFATDVRKLRGDAQRADQAMLSAFQGAASLKKARATYERTGGVDIADGLFVELMTLTTFGSPESINDWWQGLNAAEQQALIAAHPDTIGNLDGIPAGARDDANRIMLDQDLALLQLREEDGTLQGDEEDVLRNVEEIMRSLDEMNSPLMVDPMTGEPVETQLYIYDPYAFGGDGRVAISVGDLGTADNVSIQVPGLGTDADSAPTHTERAFNVYTASRYADQSATIASLMWIGYDAPDNLPWAEGGGDWAGVATEGAATEGGERLADTIDGLRGSRDDPAHLTLIGHSYGSTTVGHAGHDQDVAVDDIVLIGSPGAGGDTDHASDLNIDSDHVWAGLNSRDIVGQLGNHGSVHGETFFGAGLGDDPAEDDFGANRFTAESTTRHEDTNNIGDHTKYYDKNTESLHNISQIVTGEYDEVQEAPHVHDPWFGDPEDPERDREPTAPSTGG